MPRATRLPSGGSGPSEGLRRVQRLAGGLARAGKLAPLCTEHSAHHLPLPPSAPASPLQLCPALPLCLDQRPWERVRPSAVSFAPVLLKQGQWPSDSRLGSPLRSMTVSAWCHASVWIPLSPVVSGPHDKLHLI